MKSEATTPKLRAALTAVADALAELPAELSWQRGPWLTLLERRHPRKAGEVERSQGQNSEIRKGGDAMTDKPTPKLEIVPPELDEEEQQRLVRIACPDIKAHAVALAIADYCRGASYHAAMVEDANRVDLDGNAAGHVTKGAAERARNILKKLEAQVP